MVSEDSPLSIHKPRTPAEEETTWSPRIQFPKRYRSNGESCNTNTQTANDQYCPAIIILVFKKDDHQCPGSKRDQLAKQATRSSSHQQSIQMTSFKRRRFDSLNIILHCRRSTFALASHTESINTYIMKPPLKITIAPNLKTDNQLSKIPF